MIVEGLVKGDIDCYALATALSPLSSRIELLKSPSLHDLQLYGVITTFVLCLIVFGGVKIINKVAPAFLFPVLLSVFLIFIGIFAAPREKDPSGLRWQTLVSNWGPKY